MSDTPPHVYVISLPDSQSRRENIAKLFDELRMPWRFFDAHREASADLSIESKHWKQLNGRNLKPSELACYSSHYAIWKETADLPDGEYSLVFEDDAIIDPDFFNKIHNLSDLARKYQYVRFAVNFPAAFTSVGKFDKHRVLRFRGMVHGALGYLITPEAARRLLEFRVIRRPVDIEMDRYWVHGLPIYGVYPFPALERAEPSGIGVRAIEERFTRSWWIWKLNRRIEAVRRAVANVALDFRSKGASRR